MTTATMPRTIFTCETGEYSIWKHVERRQFDVFVRRPDQDRSAWIGWADGPGEALRLAERHAAEKA